MAFVTGAMPQAFWKGEIQPRPGEDPNDLYLEHKRWCAVLHRFDADGNHLRTETCLGGMDADGRRVACDRADDLLSAALSSLADVEFCEIELRLFSTEVDGVLFGLIYHSYEEQDGDEKVFVEYVMLEPNDIMFHPPWDGTYST
jgi:formate hydrogenlyase regulatory protein HycA